MSSALHRQPVVDAVRQWQTRLLQLDRRNALLYFKIGKRGVTLTGVEPDTLLERLATSRSGLTFTFAERVRVPRGGLFDLPSGADREPSEQQIRVYPGDVETDLPPLELQKRLGALSRRSREWQEEQGLNVLFLALGILRWVDEDQEPAISPLLLVPCDLSHASPRDPFILAGDESEDPVVNPTLRHKLVTAAGITLPEFGEGTIEAYIAAVGRIIAAREGWSVEPSVVLATFPFSKLAMWEDLDVMASTGISHPLVRRLAGDANALVEPPPDSEVTIPTDDVRLQGAGLDDLLNVRDQHAVMDADFSQLRAIELARSGASLVIHGPPGTGKSQTIANVVATLLAEGRRVLFVSEKTAALDVVKRRLTEAGLGAFCLDLHSERGKKASVYAQLRAALDQPAAAPREFPYERLVARRNELNSIVRELHRVRQPLGLSAFSVHGRVAQISDVPRPNTTFHDISTLDGERLRRIEDALSRIARRPSEYRDHETNPWRCLGPIGPSPALADTLRNDLTGIRLAVVSVARYANTASALCGVPGSETLSDAMHLVELVCHFKSARGAVPAQWLAPGGLARAQECALSLRRDTDERSRLVAALREVLCSDPPGPHSREWLATACAVAVEATRWERIGGPRWSAQMLADPPSYAVQWRQIAERLDALASASVSLQSLLGVTRCLESRIAVDACVALATRIAEVGHCPSSWDSGQALLAVRREVVIARELRDKLLSTEAALFGCFGPEIVEQVQVEMLVRYRTDYQSWWRWLRTAFRRDQRKLRACLKVPGKLQLGDALAAIERGLAVRRLRLEWSQAAVRLQDLLGQKFTATEPDWAGIEAALDAVAGIYREHPSQGVALHAVIVDQRKLEELADCARAARERARALDAVWPDGCDPLVGDIRGCAFEARALADAAERVGRLADALGPFARRPADLGGFIDILRLAVQLEELEDRSNIETQSRAAAIGAPFSGWLTDLDALGDMLDWTQQLIELAPKPVPAAMTERAMQPPSSALCAAAEADLRDAVTALRAAFVSASSRFPEERLPWAEAGSVEFRIVSSWCAELCDKANEASDWLEYRAAAEALDDAAGPNVAVALRGVTDDANLAPDVAMRQIYQEWLAYVYGIVPALQFAPRDMAGVIKEYRDLDGRLPEVAREWVRARCLAALDGVTNTHRIGELGVLSHQLSLRRRQMPVRRLVAKIPNLLQKLKPCLMMSPLAVSQYLPRGVTDAETLSFDAVLFDEASQVFPEDAVPALARARQCIVVGDQQQLPPTSFFRADDPEDEQDGEEDGGDVDEDRLANVESILDVLVGMRGAGIQDVYLQVHYRSQHDALIRYSNHYFYDDRLLTFPSALSARPGLGIRSEYLADGRFEAGGSRTNRVEGQRVVDIVFELMETRPLDESIGVVALSRAQADLIQELIDLRRLGDRRFDQRFAEDTHERFFVKNLENVQGDERDHVILSIGYGPTTATGAVPNRFGPINSEGGHRRLNVAVSRARRSMTVVHSLRPEDIHSETQGARLLRRYLEFARSGEASIEGAVEHATGGEAESPFEDAVGHALTGLGYQIQRQVGCAKYWIDLAVVSEDGSGFDLGIECDGAAYHRSPSARDRDRIRQEVLERLGWRGRIHRVWSTAWIRNPRGELAAIEGAIRAARAMVRGEARPRVCSPSPPRDDERVGAQGVEGDGEAWPVTVDTETPLFAAYVEADLGRLPRGPDLRLEAPRRVADLVVAVVCVEAPVHVDLVVERVRRHYQLQRAGSRVRDAVLAGVRAAVRAQTVTWAATDHRVGNGKFLVVCEDQGVEPRGILADGTVRRIDYVSDQEIEAGVIRVVRAMVGASREDVVTATARAFGYARTGQYVEERVGKAVDRLVSAGTLLERVGSLVVKS